MINDYSRIIDSDSQLSKETSHLEKKVRAMTHRRRPNRLGLGLGYNATPNHKILTHTHGLSVMNITLHIKFYNHLYSIIVR